MSAFIFNLKKSLFIIRTHKFVSLLNIGFVFFSLLTLGKLVGMSDKTANAAKQYTETYGNKTYYFTSESFSDPMYYEYLDDEKSTMYDRLLLFEELLKKTLDFKYIEIIHQQLEIEKPAIPDKYLLNYEEGLSKESVFEFDNKVLYATKTIQVSPSFFDEYNINISSGQPFSESDYVFDDSSPIPVLLGSEYMDLFQIGDIIDGYYIIEKFRFVVKGFISEDSFFFSRMISDMVSCNRYIIMPALSFKNTSELAKVVLLQKLTGIISSSIGYEETVAIFESSRIDAKVDNLELNIVLPKAAQEGNSIFDKYSAMTREVADQFKTIVFIIMFFGILAISITLCSILRENRYNFAIEMLCGATKVDILVVAVVYLLSVLLLGDILCAMVLIIGNTSLHILLYIQQSVISMLLLSGVITTIYVIEMPIHDIIGGNE